MRTAVSEIKKNNNNNKVLAILKMTRHWVV